MKHLITRVTKHTKGITKHFSTHKHKYLFGTLGTFAIIKSVLLLAGFFGTLNIANIFAAGGELNSGNIVTEYGCATDATSCYLSSQGITSIAPDTFVNHSNLQQLYLNSNQITSIESGVFDGLSNLTTLDLGGNQITSIESGVFDGLSNLTYLNLRDNQITSIESGVFDGLSSLNELNLYGNQITSIESGDFSGLSNLTNLVLGGNQITSIESGDFSGLSNLTNLGLNSNQITSIESGVFDGLSSLNELNLYDNQITSIESGDFSGLSNLTTLDLGGNQITSIESGDFSGLSSLTYLNLGGNQITTLSEDIITLTNLRDNDGLNIYYNHIDYTQLPHELLTFIDTKHVTREGGWKTLGCIDSSANNYNSDARQDDGSCTYTIIEGCTDPDANNYNADANQDNGSCEYDGGGGEYGDNEGNLWVTGSLYNTRNIYSGTLVILPINYGYDGPSYTFATLQLATPFGFEMTDIFGSDWDTYRNVPGYGGPGDQCYAQFLENTEGYVTQTNDLLEMLLPSVIYYDSGWQIDLSIMQEGFILPVTQFTTGITQSTGLTQRVYLLAEVFHFMGTMQEDEDMIAMATTLADELDHSTPASTLIGDLCTTMSEEGGPGLNVCEYFGNIISEFILDLSFNKQESIWTLYMENIFDRISDTVLSNSGGTYYMDFTTINPDMIIPVISYQTEILATTGATQRTWIIAELFSGVGASDFAANIETALNQGSGGMELLSGICATMEIMDMGEGNLKDCKVAGEFIKNNSSFLGLDTVPDCGANIYTTNTDNYGQIQQGGLRNASVFGAFPYQEDGITFGVSLTPLLDEFHDQNRDDNNFSLHIDMVPDEGISCINSGNSMEITHGDIQEVYVVYEDVCTPIMGLCIEGDMYGLDDGATIPFPDNVYYADDTCTIPVLPTATDVQIIGDPIVGSMLTGVYDFIYTTEHSRVQLGESLIDGHIQSIKINNTIPYVLFTDGKKPSTYSVFTLSNNIWTQLGDSFSGGQQIGGLTVDNNIPYIAYYDGVENYSILTFSGENRIQLGNSFSGGQQMRGFAVDNNIPYILHYDGVENYSILTFSGDIWTQLGNSFSGGQQMRGFAVDNNIPYILHYDGVENYSILTFSGNTWIQLGDSFPSSRKLRINFFLAVDNNIPYILHYDGVENYSILTFSGENRIQLGNSFSGGKSINFLTVDNNIPYIAYYDGVENYSILTFSGENRIQLGDSFSEIRSFDVNNNIPYRANSNSIFMFSVDQQEEGPSTYQRYRDDAPIAGATALSYTTTALDTDKDISFGVVPVTENGIFGILTKSDAVHIDASQDDDEEDEEDVSPVRIGGGGGGGSSFQRDICEGRDCSNSYYDGFCGPCDIDEYEQQKIHGAAQSFLIQHKELFDQEVEKVRASTTKTYSDELLEAYTFAKDLGVTTMDTIDNANLEGSLIRSHMAKMITNYAIKVLQIPINTGATCSFSDMKYESEEMQEYAILSCQLGLMGQNITKFRPNDIVTRAEFGTILSRMLRGDKYEGGTPYYTKHLSALKSQSIMNEIETPTQKEMRGRVMLMLMRTFEK